MAAEQRTPQGLPDGIDGTRTDLVEEFRLRPLGRHSPDLQTLLNHMRGGPIGGKHFLLLDGPHTRWVLARFTTSSPPGVERFPDRVFDDIEDAERHVFDLRWEQMFGAGSP